MPSPSTSLSLFSFSLLLFLFLPSLLAQPPPPPPSSSSACKFTLYPKLCRSILSVIGSSPSDPYGFGKFSIKQSLKQAKKLAKVFEDFLKRHRSSSPEAAALFDCHDLNLLNVDYLDTVAAALQIGPAEAAAATANAELAERVESYLSAVATNHYTCYDGLVGAKSNIAKALAVPLMNVTQLYSVSLGLVSEALNQNQKKKMKTRKHGLPTHSYRVRQPLEKLIQVIIVNFRFFSHYFIHCKKYSLHFL